MRRNEHTLARRYLWFDFRFKIRRHARDRIFQAFRQRKLHALFMQTTQSGHQSRISGIVFRERRRLHIVAATPELHLLRAVFLRRLAFIEALERAVMTLIQMIIFHDRNPRQIELVQHRVRRMNRPFQDRRVADVKRKSVFAKERARLMRFGKSFLRQIHIRPAAE